MHELPRRQMLSAFSVAALSAVTLTACGTKITGQASATKASGKISYWAAWNMGEPQQIILDNVVQKFSAESGVEVEVKYLGRQVTQNLINALGNGEGPDLFDAGTRNIADFSARGFLANLDPLMKMEIPNSKEEVGATFSDNVLKAASSDKGVSILPTYINSNAIWFNAERFPELVNNPPKTWDAFIALLDQQRSKGLTPLGSDGTVPGYNVFWLFQSLMTTAGPGSLRALAIDAANWDKPAVLQAAQMVQKIARGGYIQPGYMGTKFPDAQNRWATNEFSFMLNGSYMGGETAKQQSEKFQANTFLFPKVPGGFSTVEVTASGIAANAKSKNLDAALAFLAFAAHKDYQSLYATKAGFLAARADVAQPKPLLSLFAAIESAEKTTGALDLAAALHPAWWNDILLPLDDKLFSGSITAEEFVAQGKKLTTTFLATSR